MGCGPAGIRWLVRTMAMADARGGVMVDRVVPCDTATGLVATTSTDALVRAGFVGRTPLGRAGTVGGGTGMVTYLASDESSFSTGATFRADGGTTTRRVSATPGGDTGFAHACQRWRVRDVRVRSGVFDVTVAVIGVGGKMGQRVSNNLAKSACRASSLEESPNGRGGFRPPT